MIRNIVAIAVLVAGAYYAWNYLNAPKSYEECLLTEMRGHPEAMLPAATATCERRFNIETALPTISDNWTWSGSGLAQEISFTPSFLRRFAPSRARFSFSAKDCRGSSFSDWVDVGWSTAVADKFRLYFSEPSEPLCMRIESLYGYRR